MTNSSSVETKLITTKEAASMSGYSSSHLGHLAREGKLVAKQEKGRWLIDATSLRKYLKSASKTPQSIRQQKKTILTPSPLKKAHYSALVTFEQATVSPLNLRSLLESLAIAGCSVLVGMLIQGSYVADVTYADFTHGTESVVMELLEKTADAAEGAANMAASFVYDPERN